MEVNQRLIHLLAKRIGKNASKEEEEELNRLLKDSPGFTFFIELLDAVESEKRVHQPEEKEDLIAESWELLKNSLNIERGLDFQSDGEVDYPWHHENKQIKWRKFLKRAAVWVSILILAGVGLWFITGHKQDKSSLTTVATTKQITQTVQEIPKKFILPDKSVVWLNSQSSIRYNENFTKGKREVYVDGEAYFNVKDDAGHPFIVHAGDVDIKVLGTSFNVKAYKKENKVETTLVNGKIKVLVAGNPDKSFVLKPDEKLTIQMNLDKVAKEVKKLKPDIVRSIQFKVEELKPPKVKKVLPEVAWKKDQLTFQDEPFGKLAKSLERRYDVTIIFKDKSLKKENLTGTFKNETIQKAMKILQMTTPFQYEIKGDMVYLSR